MQLHPHTFGKYPASVTLAKILNDAGNPKVSSYVARQFVNFTRGVRVLAALPEHGVRATVLHLWRDKFLQNLRNTPLPPEVQTYTENVFRGVLRDVLSRKSRERRTALPMTSRESFLFLRERYLHLLWRPAAGHTRSMEAREVEALYVALRDLKEASYDSDAPFEEDLPAPDEEPGSSP